MCFVAPVDGFRSNIHGHGPSTRCRAKSRTKGKQGTRAIWTLCVMNVHDRRLDLYKAGLSSRQVLPTPFCYDARNHFMQMLAALKQINE
jgi:hypothetical protein